ncbi:hypothetical protein ACWEOZ_32820 [Actinoplanes sp. NPDC004185]
MSNDRVPVEDPAFMRRATRRMTIALIFLLVVTTFFTVGGVSLVVADELSGLPFAVGGAVLQIGAIALVIATWNIRRTLDGKSVARASLLTARRTSSRVRRITLATVIALIAYGIVRTALGDPLSLVTACIIGLGLLLLARGSKTIGHAQEQSLSH